jgi:hypothetical protein
MTGDATRCATTKLTAVTAAQDKMKAHQTGTPMAIGIQMATAESP